MTGEEPKIPLLDRLEHNSLYRLCRQLLVIMRLGGIFFMPTIEEQRCGHTKRKRLQANSEPERLISAQERWEYFWKYYGCFAFAVMVMYLAKFIVNFRSVAQTLGPSIMTTTNLGVYVWLVCFGSWHGSLVVIHAIMLRACSKSSLLYDFFIKWEDCRYHCSDYSCNAFSDYFRPRRNAVLALTVVLTFLNLITLWLPLLISHPEYAMMRSTLYAGFGVGNPWIGIFTVIAHFYGSIVYVAPVMMYILLSFAISDDFNHLNSDLSERINDKGELNGSLEWFRLRHSKLCALTEQADNIFSLLILVSIGVSVAQLFMMVFVTYDTVAKGGVGTVMSLTLLFWFLIYTLQPGLFFWMGMKVNDAAHSLLGSLYQLDHEKLTTREVLQLHTFLNKLACSQIGFTGGKMFTVDAPALLSIMGIYWTYQILLFQLQLDLEDGQPVNVTRPV